MKILITNHHLKNFAGSELHTFDLCIVLKKMGHDVLVGTYFYDYPLKSLFEKENIKVYNFLNAPADEKYFDLIIGHHFPIISDALILQKICCKKLILHSMSLFENLEAFIHFDEKYCVYTAHSKQNKEYKEKKGIQDAALLINSVPERFFTFPARDIKNIRSIAMVSNHVCDELKNAIQILADKNISTTVYGVEEGHIFAHITPEILSKYDAIITIGRTVQYGLSLGIPVYCYDHFGGPGWITKNNMDHTESFNFSGCCSTRKKLPEEIAGEILNQHGVALEDRYFLRFVASTRYGLEKNISSILTLTEKKRDFNLENALQNVKSIAPFSQHAKNVLIQKVELEKNQERLLWEIENISKNLSAARQELKLIKQSARWRATQKLSMFFANHPLLRATIRKVLKCAYKALGFIWSGLRNIANRFKHAFALVPTLLRGNAYEKHGDS